MRLVVLHGIGGLVGFLLVIVGLVRLDVSLLEGLGGGIVDANAAGTPGLDEGGVDFIEGFLLVLDQWEVLREGAGQIPRPCLRRHRPLLHRRHRRHLPRRRRP